MASCLPSGLYRAMRISSQSILGSAFSHNLPYLAHIYRSDKGTVHDYASFYGEAFRKRRLEKLVVFEIGVGGYSDPFSGGQSLQMWSKYFPNSTIVGIDYYQKTLGLPPNVFLERADQSSPSDLMRIVEKYGAPDIVIDDGSHFSDHIKASFSCLFPVLRDGGFYCIEDLHTSYWPSGFCGENWEGSVDVYSKATSVAMIKRCIDSLNVFDMLEEPTDVLPCDKILSSIYCARGIAILRKSRRSGERKPAQHIEAMRRRSLAK